MNKLVMNIFFPGFASTHLKHGIETFVAWKKLQILACRKHVERPYYVGNVLQHATNYAR